MEKQILINSSAPKAIGPYSPALKIGNLVFISGQLPIDPSTGEIVEGGISAQTEKSLENIKIVMQPFSINLENIVKVTIFLNNIRDFPIVNEIYSKYFSKEFPTRSCVEVSSLPKDAQIEIEAIAYSD